MRQQCTGPLFFSVDGRMPSPRSRRRCPARTPRRSSSATRRSCRRPTPAAIRSSSSAASGAVGRRRRRQPLPRLRGRHRRQLDRPLASRRRARHQRAGRRSSSTCRAPISTTSRRSGWPRSSRRSRRSTAACGRSSATPAPRPSRPALKLARYATGRPNIIAFFGGFHGRTMGALALTASKVVQRRGFGPFMPGVYPRAVRRLLSLSAVARSPRAAPPSASISSTTSCWSHLVSPDEVAAILVEPIQGEGGYVVAPDVFMQRLRELTERARHAAHRRRSAVGHGPHRHDVRHRAHRRPARRHRDRQGHCVGPAARRGASPAPIS